MQFSLATKRYGGMHVQRNALLGLCTVLLTVALLQSAYLFMRHEKTIIVPPEIKQSFWVEGNQFAPAYLEEQALYFAHLLLDVSESNILYQGDILLRYVAPSDYSAFRTKLMQDLERLKKENLSLSFAPVECEVFPGEMTVHLTGDLCGYVGGKKVTTHRQTYRLTFTGKQGRLFLSKFQSFTLDPLKETPHDES